MEVWDAHAQPLGLQQEEILPFIIEKLRAGNILAIKGIGGFLLMVDASNADGCKNAAGAQTPAIKTLCRIVSFVGIIKTGYGNFC
jgi:hypothetical protein